jgi:hypothetical protein
MVKPADGTDCREERTSSDPAALFQGNMDRLEEEEQTLARRISRMSNWRLLVFLLGLGGVVAFSFLRAPVFAWLTGGVALALFLVLVAMHERAYRSQRRAGAYLEVNRMSWKRLTGGWHELPEDGSRFLDPSHPYAADLDVFGPGSLYQFCSTAVTPAGQSLFGKLVVRRHHVIRGDSCTAGSGL